MFEKCLLKLNGYDESITRQDGRIMVRLPKEFMLIILICNLFYRQTVDLTRNEKKLFNTRAKILQNHATKFLNYKDKICLYSN